MPAPVLFNDGAADGVRLHYLVYGRADAAQTVVLLHGNGTMGEDIDISGVAGQLARDYRVIAFDRPGYGCSERPGLRALRSQDQADLIVEALGQLDIHDPVVLGHSWGANVALAMGIRHPARTGALVLASGYYTPSLRLDVLLASAPALPLIGALMRHTISPLLGRLLWPLVIRRMFAPAPTTPAFKQRVMTPWHSMRLNERLPYSSLQSVEGAGHMVHHTAPDQVVAAVHRAAGLVEPVLTARNPVEPPRAPLPAMGLH